MASAAAQDDMCGDLPIAPEMPTLADMQQKPPAEALAAKRAAFADIKRWQGALKTYRDCLDATVDTDNRQLGETQRSDKPDTKKIAKLRQNLVDLKNAWDASVDDEERVVNQWNAAGTAFCLRADVDRSTCPKR
ncbi:MAG TPA: hypothetical protein VHX61_11235 [Rhizomicrobium sp.]|nr:hypothetical protein [Rhizomicrobium sp.]